ncbi:MAG TPA: efflux RND transporter periplasmic adaptor subunit [Candidatus Eisenbacteria bacterium]
MNPPVIRVARAGAAPAVVAALLFGATLAGCGRGERVGEGPASGEATHRVGVFEISVENRPARPAVGDNVVTIAVRDSSGSPVRAADVKLLVEMQAMGTMPRMESRGEGRETQAGVYEAKYGIAMAGDWNLSVSVRSEGRPEAIAHYRVSTSTKEILFDGGTPPAGGAGGTGTPASHAGHGMGGSGEIDAGESGVVSLDPARRQAIGVRTAPVSMRRLLTTIRAAGRVAYDETRRTEISLKFNGWVREIYVDYPGKVVRAGEPLLTVYSPELLTAQQEYLESLRASSSGSVAGSGGDPDLAAAARQRLLLWDIAAEQIDAIAKSGKPMEAVPIVAPSGGVVLEKNVVRGSSFAAGQTLYKITPVDPVWVVASVFQYELPLVREGMGATVETPVPGEPARRGRVSYINPYLDPETRTGEVRLQVPNPHGDLKPGMFVEVALQRDLGLRLAVPESAVLYAGERRVVFVDLGDGRLAPRDVTLGAKAGNYYEVVAGLAAGDVVVTSGNFLIAAESKLRSAQKQ